MHEAICSTIADRWAVRVGRPRAILHCAGATAWDLVLTFAGAAGDHFQVRAVAPGDERTILAFGAGLSTRAQEMFCPYPWLEPAHLAAAVAAGVQQSLGCVDAAYLLFAGDVPAGHFFLWKAGGNPHSLAHGVQVPELGVAIADAWQGQGLGGLAVRLLLAVARHLDADAVELTTALDNEAGWRTYLGAGFEYVGTVDNPLEVDVTAAVAGQAAAARYRVERQMVFVVKPERREAVLAYLAQKRAALAAAALSVPAAPP